MNNTTIIISSLLVLTSSLAAYTPKLSFNSTVTQVTSANGPLDPTDSVTAMTNTQIQSAIQAYIDAEEIYENELLTQIGLSNTETSNALSDLQTAQGTQATKQSALSIATNAENNALIAQTSAQDALAVATGNVNDYLNASTNPPINPNDTTTWTTAYELLYDAQVNAQIALNDADADLIVKQSAKTVAQGEYDTAVLDTATKQADYDSKLARNLALNNTDVASLGALQRTEARINEAEALKTLVSNSFDQHVINLDDDSALIADFQEDIIDANGNVLSIEDIIEAAELIIPDDDGRSVAYTGSLVAKDSSGGFGIAELDPSNDPDAAQYNNLLNNLNAHLSSETSHYTTSEKNALLTASGQWCMGKECH